MTRRLWGHIIEDWERQPLAIISQATSICLAAGIAVWGAVAAPSTGALSYSFSGASTPLALTVLASSLAATACRAIFKNSIIGGFLASLVAATACLMLFSQMAVVPLVKTSAYLGQRYEGPLIDIAYWAVFCIFASLCATPAIARIFATWGQIRDDGSEEPRGIAPIELIIFAALWGWCLSGAQQRILGAFVFERPPAISETPK